MEYSEDFLRKIKSFGALQYTIDRIISILNPEDPQQLKDDFTNPESVVCIMYNTGFNAGQYRIDVESFKLAELETRQKQIEVQELEKRIEMRKQLFGI